MFGVRVKFPEVLVIDILMATIKIILFVHYFLDFNG